MTLLGQGHICFSVSLYLPKEPEKEGITFLFQMKMMLFKEFGPLIKVTQLAVVVLGLELIPDLSGCCLYPQRAGQEVDKRMQKMQMPHCGPSPG